MQRTIPSKGGLASRATQRLPLLRLVTAAAFAVAGLGSAMAGTASYDFTSDPSTDPTLVIVGNNDAPWQADGGNTGGFLALTYPQGSQNTTVVFADIDAGRLVKAFRFDADVRVGNGSVGARAADGFSISFARGGDPVLVEPNNVNNFAVAGAPENGTRTGIAVSFDTWSGNELPDGRDFPDAGAADDPGGLIVRVDNVTILRQATTLYHGACEDINSLQTGPRDAAYWADGGDARAPESWATLCWQPISINLDETGKLSVAYKNQVILTNFQTTYFPSVGQLVLAGRTGGDNEHQHLDNIRITTILADQPLIGLPVGSSCGFDIPIADAGTITPNMSTLTVTFNGAAIPTTNRREGANTILSVVTPSVLAAGSTNTVVVSFTSSSGAAVSATRQYVAPASVTIPPSAKASAFTAASSGFLVRSHMMDTARGPGDANFIENAETQLGGRFTDSSNVATPNTAEVAPAGGFFTSELVNWDQNASDIDANNPDNFNSVEPTANPRPNEAIPGVSPADVSNVATEILTFLELPAGCTTLGVNSDDGFLVTLGHSQYGTMLGQFNGGRGASDTTFRIIATEAGVYPIRLSWWEGGGGGNVEFFSVTAAGEKILVNDRATPGHIKAYSGGTAPGVLADFGATRANVGVNPGSSLIATFTDGSTTVDDASIRLSLNGTTVTPTVTNDGRTTTVRFTPTSNFALGSAHTASLVYSIGGVSATNTVTFSVRVDGFFIEAEHFNYDSGQFNPAVNTMPYDGSEYQDLGAVHDVDYHQPGNEPSGDLYRIGEDPNVPVGLAQDAGTLDVMRGESVVTVNYSIGWAGDDWYNYTRTFTNGNYMVWAAQSHGDAAGLPDRQRIRLAVRGTGDTEETIGSYSVPSSGVWGTATLNQVKNGPVPAVVNLSGNETIRAYVASGDFDWFVFVPTTNAVSTPNFIIEAEDFNFGSGQTMPAASTMPLTTAPYDTLGAVAEVDYHVIGDVTDAGSDFYRTNELPHVPINENNALNQNDRGLFVRAQNYKIGWADSGEWFNYTRTFPAANYNVWAAISHGGGATDRTSGSLQTVTGATTTTQTVNELGTFDAPGATGGWGNNRLVPLQSGGSLATIALGGEQTIRYTIGSGDFDYLVFVPTTTTVTPTGIRITGTTRVGNQLTITWTGGGTLESTPALGAGAVWTTVPGTGTATVTMDGAMRFFRVRG